MCKTCILLLIVNGLYWMSVSGTENPSKITSFISPSISSPDINAKGVIVKAFEQYRLKTCIDYKPWSGEENYISVFKGSGWVVHLEQHFHVFICWLFIHAPLRAKYYCCSHIGTEEVFVLRSLIKRSQLSYWRYRKDLWRSYGTKMPQRKDSGLLEPKKKTWYKENSETCSRQTN